MPTKSKVLIKEKTGFTPLTRSKGGRDEGMTRARIRTCRRSRKLTTFEFGYDNPFFPLNRPSAATGSGSPALLPNQLNQNDYAMPATGVRDARRNLFDGSSSFVLAQKWTQGVY